MEYKYDLRKINYDGAWKRLVTKQFRCFVEFFFAGVSKLIDWEKGFEFLDAELEKLFPHSNEGKKYADKLVKLTLNDGNEQWVLVHLEIQNYKDETISERMFTYYYKILDLYKKNIISLLLLTDQNRIWRPEPYIRDICGTEVVFKYNIAKLLDFYSEGIENKRIGNPFEIATLIHIKSQQIKDPDKKLEAKLDIIRVLVTANKLVFQSSKELIHDMFIFLDWLLMLPEGLNEEFKGKLEKMKGEKGMESLDWEISPTFWGTYNKGLEEGRSEGELNAVYNFIKNGLVTTEQAAKSIGLSVQELLASFKRYNLAL